MKIMQEISLLLAGTVIGSLLYSQNKIKLSLFWIITLFSLLILIGVGLLNWLYILFIKIIRKINIKDNKIGIFSPYELDDDNSSWIEVSLRQIKQGLLKSKIRFIAIHNERDFYKFPVIMNPYGGVYPENNVVSLSSLDNIFLYVRSGGVYINIADIPFYYAYEKNLNRRIDTTPFIGNLSTIRSFLDTLLSKKLQVLVFGITEKKYNDQNIYRVISLADNSINLFNESIPIDYQGIMNNYSPILSIPYGKGYFVFSTISVNKQNINQLSNLIYKSLNLINEK